MTFAFALLVAIVAHESPAEPAQTVLAVLPRGDGDGAEQARRFARQLVLVLDGVQVATTELDHRAFYGLPLNEQVQLLRARLPTAGASAAVWLSRADDTMLLHFMVRRGEGVEVRTAAAPLTGDVETVFALMVRELLTGGYLRVAGGDHAMWQRIVTRARETPVRDGGEEPAPPSEPSATENDVVAGVGVVGSHGLAGGEGPTTTLGARLGVETSPHPRWRLGLWAGGDSSFQRDVGDGRLSWLTASLGPSLAYVIPAGASSFAPRLQVAGSVSRYALELGEGTEQSYARWNGHVGMGLEWRSPALGAVKLALAPELVWNLVDHAFARVSTEEVVVRVPRLTGRVVLTIYFPSR